MTLKEAKDAQEARKTVKHIDGNTWGYISCFDDDKTGVYIRPSYLFIPLESLVGAGTT